MARYLNVLSAAFFLLLLTANVSASTIYVLRCHTYTATGVRVVERSRNVKYYVGKTDRSLDERLAEHDDGGNAWTRGTECELIWFAQDFEISPFDPSQAEDIVFMWMVRNKGDYIADGLNVRGARFTKQKLSLNDEIMIRSLVDHTRGACLKCSRTSHFARECFARRTKGPGLSAQYFEDIGTRPWSAFASETEFPFMSAYDAVGNEE